MTGRRPDRTQETVRRALRLYGTAPDGYPGNDDLGTLSSWYVFAALGLYPEVPGVGLLAIGSPLFAHASVALAHRRRLTVTATAHESRGRGKTRRTVALAPARAPYIAGLRVDGRPYGRPWATWCALASGAHLAFRLSPKPDRRWGSSAAAAPPSFGPGRAMPGGACAP